MPNDTMSTSAPLALLNEFDRKFPLSLKEETTTGLFKAYTSRHYCNIQGFSQELYTEYLLLGNLEHMFSGYSD